MAVKTAPYDPVRHLSSPWAQAELRPELHEVAPNRPGSSITRLVAHMRRIIQPQNGSRASTANSTKA